MGPPGALSTLKNPLGNKLTKESGQHLQLKSDVTSANPAHGLTDEVAKPPFLILEKLWLSGKGPSDWNRGNITLIFKKGKNEYLGNGRPVSLTSCP